MAALRILGRVTLVALFICTLVAVALAQDNTTSLPAVVVDDQASLNNTVTVRQVNAPQAAFLVIQRDLVGIPGPIIGQAAVSAGMNENVVVPLTETVAPGNLLYAALYVDAGQAGVFEVPGADAPFVLNDQTIAQPFTIAAASSDQSAQLTQQAQLTPTLTTSPTAPLSPLASPTVIVSPTVAATPQGLQAEVTATIPLPDLQATATTQAVPPTPLVGATPTAVVPIQATVDAAEAQATLTEEAPPAEQQAPPLPPTQTPTVLITPTPLLTPTPALMPVTGAGDGAHLPVTFLMSVMALALVVGSHTFLRRLRRS